MWRLKLRAAQGRWFLSGVALAASTASGIEQVLNTSTGNRSEPKVPQVIHHYFKKEDKTSFLKETIRKGLKKVVAYELGIKEISKHRG